MTFTHARCHPLSEKKSCPQVDIQSVIPLLQRDFLQALLIPHAGIANKEMFLKDLEPEPVDLMRTLI
jgi:hypothetical protein